MKQYHPLVSMKWVDTQISFTTPEAWAQGHSGQDIHSTTDNNGTPVEVFIPEHSISRIDFSIETTEAVAPEDVFCGNGIVTPSEP